MSLTDLVEHEEVRQAIEDLQPPPQVNHPREIEAEPLTDRPPLIGTAFDYLLRFEIERLNPNAESADWVAETALAAIGEGLVDLEALEAAATEAGFADLATLTEAIHESLDEAQTHHERFLKADQITRQLLESALDLARLDSIYRPGPFQVDLGTYPEDDLRDLWQLYEAIPTSAFEAEEVHLNPTFGEGSLLVGGADADVILDDTLVEVKTWKTPSLRGELWAQLVGYALLNEIADEEAPAERIEQVGVYWSRHGHLWTCSIEDLYDRDGFDQLLSWFVSAADKIPGRT